MTDIQTIHQTGFRLRLPQLCISTAIAISHRFFAERSTTKFDPFVLGCAALFLAGKVCECPRRLRDIINTAHHVVHNNTTVEIPKMEEYWSQRDLVVQYEQLLLRTLAYDVNPEYTYQYLLIYLKMLGGSQEIAQVPWNMLNDSYRTTLCLEHSASAIAVGVLYVSSLFLGVSFSCVSPMKKWWEAFSVSDRELIAISERLIAMYDAPSSE
eukprot:GILK01015077.1.p1 GENE.GILK01015077.1~~GILK01015077.1.p1  ORF type:complete len:221 (+),score=24.59 GILK01015077.1:32-664(+)